LIDNCVDCKTKCCSVGPGPHEAIDPGVFLLNYGENDNYNKKCSAFVDEKCSLWDKPEMPLECMIYVCQNRSFSKSELKDIRKLTGRET